MRAATVTLPRVAREIDHERLKAIRAIFGDTASNVPDFTDTALAGRHRSDEGLRNVLPQELTDYERRTVLKQAIVAALDRGDAPTIERSQGDMEMQLDPACFYHFRVTAVGVRLFIKDCVEQYGEELVVLVISVKRDDQTWK